MWCLRPSLGETSHLCSSDDQFNPFRPNPVLGVVAGASRRARRSIGTAVLLQYHCAMYHCSKQSNAPRRSTAPRRFTAPRKAATATRKATASSRAHQIATRRTRLENASGTTGAVLPCGDPSKRQTGAHGPHRSSVERSSGATHLPIPKGEWSESSAQYCKKL